MKEFTGDINIYKLARKIRVGEVVKINGKLFRRCAVIVGNGWRTKEFYEVYGKEGQDEAEKRRD